MSEYEIMCEECGWVGTWEELVCSDDDTKKPVFNVCPDCGEVDCFEDLEN